MKIYTLAFDLVSRNNDRYLRLAWGIFSLKITTCELYLTKYIIILIFISEILITNT